MLAFQGGQMEGPAVIVPSDLKLFVSALPFPAAVHQFAPFLALV